VNLLHPKTGNANTYSNTTTTTTTTTNINPDTSANTNEGVDVNSRHPKTGNATANTNTTNNTKINYLCLRLSPVIFHLPGQNRWPPWFKTWPWERASPSRIPIWCFFPVTVTGGLGDDQMMFASLTRIGTRWQ